MSTDTERRQLQERAKAGDLAGVQDLLDRVETWHAYGREMALEAAAGSGHLDVATALLDAGADPNWGVEHWLLSALHLAARRRNAAMIALLLTNGAQVNVIDSKSGATPLHELLGPGYEEATQLPLVRRLLAAGADPNLPASRHYQRGQLTPFQLALKHGALETAELLLAQGVDLDQRNGDRKTALMLATEQAARDDDLTLLVWLLELGADPNAAEYEFQRTPLTLAAEYNRVGLIDYLVQAGAEVDRNYALLTAVGRGRVEAARRLLELGADPNKMKRTEISPDWTSEEFPLMKAIDNPAMVQLLLEHGAKVDVKVRVDYNDTLTPLEYARARRYPHSEEVMALLTAALAAQDTEKARRETARYLDAELANVARDPRRSKPLAHWLERGADPNGCNAYGRAALHYVAEHGRSPEEARLLLEAGADPNARDPFGYTPLHDSVLGNNAEMIQLLLDAGADPAARIERGIHHGHTALEIARIERKKNAMRLLAPLSPEPRPLTPCEPELRRDGSVKGFSHTYYEEDAAKNELAKAGKRGHHIYLRQTGTRPYWTGRKGETKQYSAPCVRTIAYDIRSQYRGTGIPRAEHPLRWRMAMDACLHCGSEEVLVIHGDWGVQPHSGDAAWSYEVRCQQCGYYSSWGYDDS